MGQDTASRIHRRRARAASLVTAYVLLRRTPRIIVRVYSLLAQSFAQAQASYVAGFPVLRILVSYLSKYSDRTTWGWVQ